MSKLLRRALQEQEIDAPGRFERFFLAENPFPADPFINEKSSDKRMNGGIYEMEIRKKEYEQIEKFFLKRAHSDPNHIRLGYLIDTSYIGRGNGKSAFLVNLQQAINRDYCLDISEGVNKCFAIYVQPEPGGRTKTFASFVDMCFQSILSSNIISTCIASLRLEAINELYPASDVLSEVSSDEDTLIRNLNSQEWFERHSFDISAVSDRILRSRYLQDLPTHFPLFAGRRSLLRPFVSQSDFADFYSYGLRKGRERLDFLFSHLVQLFLAAGFNGAYVFVDDFERIPDFQSERQKRDFALELRSCLFDGLSTNARVGFYTFLLVLHAGVPRSISSAWEASGMEHRAPIMPKIESERVIRFEKLSREHASLLLRKYLAEYRIEAATCDPLFPFTPEAVSKIGELSEYNAARILRTAYTLLDKAADIPGQGIIDESFVMSNKVVEGESPDRSTPTIDTAESTDLRKKAQSWE